MFLVKPLIWFAVIVGGVVAGFFAASELGFVSGGKNGEQQAQGPGLQGPSPKSGSIEDSTVSGEQRAQLALAKTKQKRFVSQANEALGLIDEWLKELKSFESQAASLLTNDDGKRLAGSPELLSQINAVLREDRPGKDKAQELRSSVEQLAEAVSGSLKDPSDASLPSEELTKQLASFLAEAKDARTTVRKARERVESLTERAKAEGTPGTLTLREAITQLRREEAAREAKVIETARAKAQEEATRKLADAKAESARLEGEKQRELELARRTTTLATKERERMTTLAKDPAIQADFKAFLIPGRFTFARGDNAYAERSLPLSLTTIKRNCCLNDTKRFAQAMCGEWVRDNLDNVVVNGGNNDRPKSVWPRTDADWKRWDELYDRFCRLAPYWVEMGLLSK
jgi:hypothetical protein